MERIKVGQVSNLSLAQAKLMVGKARPTTPIGNKSARKTAFSSGNRGVRRELISENREYPRNTA
jgi:hypothetical protein